MPSISDPDVTGNERERKAPLQDQAGCNGLPSSERHVTREAFERFDISVWYTHATVSKLSLHNDRRTTEGMTGLRVSMCLSKCSSLVKD